MQYPTPYSIAVQLLGGIELADGMMYAEITSFDFSTSSPSSNGTQTNADAATSHPPVETRKKKGGGGRKARGKSRITEASDRDGDHMEVVTQNENDTTDSDLPLALSHIGGTSVE